MPRILALLFSVFWLSPSIAAPTAPTPTPTPAPMPAARPMAVPKPPALAAHAYVLEDFHSGKIIAAQNAEQRLQPASITKLMTSYVVFTALQAHTIHLDDMVTISEHAWRTPGSRTFVEVGSKVSVKNLIQGMVVQSGNDATVALAEYVAGTEPTFVSMMNRYAKALGMTHTHFEDATGLPNPEHYTTAGDIAILARAIIKDFPEYYHFFDEKEFTWNKISQYNRNRLLWRDPSVDGLKTGHTDEAGYCLVSSAKRNGMRLISVMMGTNSDEARNDLSDALLNYGFRFYNTHKLYDPGQTLTQARVWKGADEQLNLGLVHPMYVTIPRGQYGDLKAAMNIPNRIVAPVSKGSPLGSVEVKLGNEVVAQQPLVALQAVPEGSFWQRMKDDALLYFQ